MEEFIGGIEAGGTTFALSVARAADLTIVDRISIPTTASPDEILLKSAQWLKSAKNPICAIGVACFGPICLNKENVRYGQIEETPKQGWSHFDVLGFLQRQFPNIPIEIDTDVNGAALAELHYGVGKGKKMGSIAYITIGTGIGVGICIGGASHIGRSHSEAGHSQVKRHECDTFPGICPFHKDCVEGLASATALAARLSIHESALKLVPDSDRVWELVAYYIGQLCANLSLILSPESIVLGGGVSKRAVLLELVRHNFQQVINCYMQFPSDYIQVSGLKNGAGVIGSQYLAARALLNRKLLTQ
uniref:fructokinase n=1 Tax=Spongospora subterranea TaxID=70186 RepID=A0A0H5QGY4_9EUKA|eukprot:CRZ00877.1 hypothetical protein [Spongospora subterranea]